MRAGYQRARRAAAQTAAAGREAAVGRQAAVRREAAEAEAGAGVGEEEGVEEARGQQAEASRPLRRRHKEALRPSFSRRIGARHRSRPPRPTPLTRQ